MALSPKSPDSLSGTSREQKGVADSLGMQQQLGRGPSGRQRDESHGGAKGIWIQSLLPHQPAAVLGVVSMAWSLRFPVDKRRGTTVQGSPEVIPHLVLEICKAWPFSKAALLPLTSWHILEA